MRAGVRGEDRTGQARTGAVVGELVRVCAGDLQKERKERRREEMVRPWWDCFWDRACVTVEWKTHADHEDLNHRPGKIRFCTGPLAMFQVGV